MQEAMPLDRSAQGFGSIDLKATATVAVAFASTQQLANFVRINVARSHRQLSKPGVAQHARQQFWGEVAKVFFADDPPARVEQSATEAVEIRRRQIKQAARPENPRALFQK